MKLYSKNTFNNENMKPSVDGLFCEKIFGPINDFQCSCRRYKKNQIKKARTKKNKNPLIICPFCNVQLTESKIRNYRMG